MLDEKETDEEGNKRYWVHPDFKNSGECCSQETRLGQGEKKLDYCILEDVQKCLTLSFLEKRGSIPSENKEFPKKLHKFTYCLPTSLCLHKLVKQFESP
jgi:hypothetical protein